jgi:hypothetical protein
MAAIGRRQFLYATFLGTPCLLYAQKPGPARSLVGDVAVGLTANNPSEALEGFSKKFPDYDKLRDYFLAITASFTLVNEVDLEEEEEAEGESTAKVRWSITLSNNGSNQTSQRQAEIHVKAVREKKKWRIVEFSPIEIFSPFPDSKALAKPAERSVLSF